MKVATVTGVQIRPIAANDSREPSDFPALSLLKVDAADFIPRIRDEHLPKGRGDVLEVGACAEGVGAGGESSGFCSCDIVGCPHAAVTVDFRAEDRELFDHVP